MGKYELGRNLQLSLIAPVAILMSLSGCAASAARYQSTLPIVENSCVQHCNLNYSACMSTANSPEARRECIDSRDMCMQGC